MRTVLSRVVVVSLVGASLIAWAQFPAPPPQAFEACKDKRADDACSVQFMERRIEGRCAPFEDKRLVCVPNGMPRP